MNENHLILIAKELSVPVMQVAAAAKLLGDGATVPFIARYRKEATGSLDEVAIAAIRDGLERLKALDDRREAIKKSLAERNLLTDELSAAIAAAETLAKLEDIYQPFKPKRRTRATVARERGLEPLADFIFNNQSSECSAKAAEFVSAEKEVPDTEAALAGARDIIAEAVSDSADARQSMRDYFERESVMSSKVMAGKEEEAAKYRDYFDWKEPAKNAPSHRILAVRRGEAEGFLIMRVVPDEAPAVEILKKMYAKGSGECAEQVKLAVEDSYKRLLAPASETHMRLELKKRADAEAISVFASNLKELLMASPLGQKNVLAIDPGFRTGCKVVCLNRQGDLLFNDVIYPEQSAMRKKEAADKILGLCARFEIEAIAIGNGTAGRETEAFARSLGLPASLPIVMVNESGASIYSASEVAREEFPDKDITVRGAVSIGRRLMDPLAELVKIDPQSIGVGQYQHDVNQTQLKRSLDDVVVSCVNSVGVEVNTASKQLLSYVSGLNAATAANIVAYRNEHGPFKSRKELMGVRGLGAKGFEQAAGFLRIRGAENPLDASAVPPRTLRARRAHGLRHGRRREVAHARRLRALENKARKLRRRRHRAAYPKRHHAGARQARPRPARKIRGVQILRRSPLNRRPPRGHEAAGDSDERHGIRGFHRHRRAPGRLAHISELADFFVKDPKEAVRPGQKVSAYVLEVDKARKRISLSLKSNPAKRVRGAGETAGAGGRDRSKSGFGGGRGKFGGRGEAGFNSFGDAFSKLGK